MEKISKLFLIACAFMTSCDTLDSATFPYTAQVLNFEGLNPVTGEPEYKISNQTFTTLRNLDALDGDYLKIKRGGNLSFKEINGSLVEPENFTGGSAPLLRYHVENGVVIPKDYSSLTMLSAYHQFDTLFSSLPSLFNVTMDDLFKNQKTHKFETFFEPKITLKDESSHLDAVMKLNAAFVPSNWQFILYRRSGIEKVPLSSNIQVLAHEFGHAIFQRYFYNGIHNPNHRIHTEYAILGLNEGFADFVSYIYTGSTDILRSSLDFGSSDGRNVADERDFAKTRFSYAEFYSDPTPSTCSSEFYCIGSLFARGLFDTSKNLISRGILDQKQFAAAVVLALPGVLESMENQVFPFEAPSKSLNQSSEFDRWVISHFLNAFIKNMPTTTRAELCQTFTSETSFGTLGYPISYRKSCGTSL